MEKRFINYNKNLKTYSKSLKQNMTKPEKKLRFDFFKPLNNKSLILGQNKVPLNKGVAGSRGIKIYKQRLIDNFIVDFYIPKIKLVIEVDGESHFDEQGIVYDIKRTSILEGLGLKVIRFTNNDIMKDFSGVCEYLEKYIDSEVRKTSI